jgi:hypothetical protein
MQGFAFRASDVAILISVALALLAIRLFRTAWQTRKAPELLAGLYLAAVPPAVSLVIRLDRFGDAREAVAIIAYLGLAVGGAALSLFTWKTFRPHAAWARWLGIALAVVIAGGMVVEVLRGRADEGTRGVLLQLPSWISSIWLFSESLHHYMLMRRRRSLGLIDPVVANRFLLFVIWTGPFVLLPLFTIGMTLVSGEALQLAQSPAYRAFVRFNGLVMFGGIWLSFFPPRAYQRWIRARHGATAAASA